MKNKDIDQLFKDLDFDVAEPSSGHKQRFEEKLKARTSTGKIRKLWSPILAVAAVLLVFIMISGNFPGSTLLTGDADMAGISPEMKETHQFYTNLIRTELERVKAAKTPETEAIVQDAHIQLEKLDAEYEKLKKDLMKSGHDKRVVFAMVSNLQQRIDILNNVLMHIENINDLKNPTYENNIF